jgi:GNAT superfamily N-acetyltransferase
VAGRSEGIDASERSQNVGALEDARLLLWLRRGNGVVWDCKSSPLDGKTSESTLRVIFVVLVAEESQQKGFGQALLDGCKLRADSLRYSLYKLPLLLQRLLQARVGSLWEGLRD